MSIRAKVLALLIGALMLSFLVSALASDHVTEADTEVSRILERNIPIARQAHAIERDLEGVLEAEGRMIRVGDASYRTQVEDAMGRLAEHAREGRALRQDAEQAGRWIEVDQLLGKLKTEERALADLIGTEVREAQGLQRRLSPRLDQLQRRVEAISDQLTAQSAAISAAPSPAALPSATNAEARDALGRCARLLQDLSRFQYTTRRYEAFAPSFQRATLPRMVFHLRAEQARLVELLQPQADLHTQALELQRRTDALVDELNELNQRVFDANARLVSQRETLKLTQARMGRVAQDIETAAWARVEARRSALARRHSRARTNILTIALIGLLTVGLMAFVILRAVSNGLARLLQASRQLRRGDLEARVELSGRDELAELGLSFNTMAQVLQGQRERQGRYNAIVTTLNSSLGLDQVLDTSLHALIQHTGSALGAIYLRDRDAPSKLRLAKGWALSSSAQQTVSIGEGIVGQVAQTRRAATLAPVPFDAFAVDLGAGKVPAGAALIVPMVHLDELLGVVTLATLGDWSSEQVRFAEEAIFQIAVSVNNARLYQTIKSTADELSRSHQALVDQRSALEEANVRLEEANVRLERAHRLRGEFLANVTHELRTPLNSIIGFTDLVLDTADLRPRHAKNLDTVLRNAQNLLALINDLLDLSKMEAGKLGVQPTSFDPRGLIDDIAEVVRPMADRKDLDLRTRFAPDLPELLHSDRQRCRQILTNLASNAIKFTDQGAVTIAAMPDGPDHVILQVTDSGIGIRPEDLAVIFEKFRQLDGSSSRRHGGTGLGLAIAQQLTHLLGGTLSVESRPQEGSTFTVRLPLTLTLQDDPESVLDTGRLAVAEETLRQEDLKARGQWDEEGGHPFIVVLDDDPSSVVNLREGLAPSGLEVKSAFTARDALDILKAFEPVGVVIGTTLPDDDGATALGDLWAHIKNQHIPVLLVWDGQGDRPLYGDTDPSLPGLPEITANRLARIVGTLSRPLDPQQTLELLRGADVLP